MDKRTERDRETAWLSGQQKVRDQYSEKEKDEKRERNLPTDTFNEVEETHLTVPR